MSPSACLDESQRLYASGDLAQAQLHLQEAESVADAEPRMHWLRGHILRGGQKHSEALNSYQQALALDRNLASAHGEIGHAKYFLGRGAETEAHVQEALRLSPRDTEAFVWMMFAGFAKLQLGADQEAVARFRRSVEINRNHPRAHIYLATALAHLGQLDEARSAAQAGLALDPTFTISRFRANVPSDNPTYLAGRERFYEGMRMAGVPEG